MEKYTARELAKHVIRNWETITGWTPDGMDEENHWHPAIEELCEEHGVDIMLFQEEFLMLREGSYSGS